MSRNAPSRQSLSELPYWELWRVQIQHWQRRLPRGYLLGTPEEILTTLAGALWLECLEHQADTASAYRALRRVLYREYEVEWSHQALPLWEPPIVPSAPGSQKLDLPAHAQDFADAYLSGLGSEGSLRRAMPHFGSKRKVRCLNSLLLSLLHDGDPLRDLKRRAARLLSAAARDGLTAPHLREAKAIQRALRMLEPKVEVRALQQSISGIRAPQKEANRAGNQECANGCMEPRATAQGKSFSPRRQ